MLQRRVHSNIFLNSLVAQMNRLEEFANETGIFGLNLLRQRVSKAEKIFWFILTIIFAVVTIRDLRDIINIYARGETVTSVSLNHTEPITLDPTPKVVLLMRNTFLETNVTSNDSLTRILESTFSGTKRPKTLPDVLFNINVRLFTQVSLKTELPFVYPLWYTKRDEISSDLLLAYNFYRDNNISLVYLQKVTGVMFCEKVGFGVKLPGDENITNICEPVLVTEMVGAGVVLILGSKPIAYYNKMDSLVMQIDRAYVEYIEKIIIDLYAISSFWSEDDGIAIDLTNVKNQENVDVRIEPVLEFKKAKRATHDCNLDPDIYCHARCISNKFFDCANCWPLSANFHIRPWNRTSICPGENLLTYSSKLQRCMQTRATNETFLTECKLFCQQQLPPCKVRIFTFTKEIAPYNGSDEIFSIRCFIPSFAFPVFEEKLALSWQTFLAQFGGALGLYLGASFASLVHIPLFLLRILASKCVKARTPPGTKPNDDIELRLATNHLTSQFVLFKIEVSSRLTAIESILSHPLQNIQPSQH